MTLKEIKEMVFYSLNINEEHFLSKSRLQYIVDAKAIFCYLAAQEKYHYTEIAKEAYINRTTIYNYMSNLPFLIKHDKDFAERFNCVKNSTKYVRKYVKNTTKESVTAKPIKNNITGKIFKSIKQASLLDHTSSAGILLDLRKKQIIYSYADK